MTSILTGVSWMIGLTINHEWPVAVGGACILLGAFIWDERRKWQN